MTKIAFRKKNCVKLEFCSNLKCLRNNSSLRCRKILAAFVKKKIDRWIASCWAGWQIGLVKAELLSHYSAAVQGWRSSVFRKKNENSHKINFFYESLKFLLNKTSKRTPKSSKVSSPDLRRHPPFWRKKAVALICEDFRPKNFEKHTSTWTCFWWLDARKWLFFLTLKKIPQFLNSNGWLKELRKNHPPNNVFTIRRIP